MNSLSVISLLSCLITFWMIIFCLLNQILKLDYFELIFLVVENFFWLERRSKFSHRTCWFFLIFVQSKVIILNSFIVISSFIFTSSSSISSIYMIRINWQNSRKILNTLFQIAHLFVTAPSDIKCPRIQRIKFN